MKYISFFNSLSPARAIEQAQPLAPRAEWERGTSAGDSLGTFQHERQPCGFWLSISGRNWTEFRLLGRRKKKKKPTTTPKQTANLTVFWAEIIESPCGTSPWHLWSLTSLKTATLALITNPPSLLLPRQTRWTLLTRTAPAARPLHAIFRFLGFLYLLCY